MSKTMKSKAVITWTGHVEIPLELGVLHFLGPFARGLNVYPSHYEYRTQSVPWYWSNLDTWLYIYVFVFEAAVEKEITLPHPKDVRDSMLLLILKK